PVRKADRAAGRRRPRTRASDLRPRPARGHPACRGQAAARPGPDHDHGPDVGVSELAEGAEPFEGEIEGPPTLPVLPLKETGIFPQSMTPLAIGQERSVKLIDDVVNGDRMLGLVTSRNSEVEQAGFDDLYDVGTSALVHRMIRIPDGTLRILVQGLSRIRLEERIADEPYPVGRFSELPDVLVETPEVEALTRTVQNQFARVVELVPTLPDELQLAAANID